MSDEMLDFDFSDELKSALLEDKPVENVIFTVGSVLRGDDAAGPLLAKMIEDGGLMGWKLICGDLTPEDELGYLRVLSPKNIILVDAADMGIGAGEIRRVSKDDVASQFLITTHSMPITYLLSQLEQMCENLIFLGIQPKQTEFFGSMTPCVRQAVEKIYELLQNNSDFHEIEFLAKEAE